MTGKVGGIQTRKLLLPDREGDDGQRVGGDAGGSQLLVETDVGIAVDGRDDANLLAVRAQGHDVAHDLGPVGMAERGVVDEDVFLGDALRDQVSLQNVVRGARIDIVGAQKRELGHAQFLKVVIHRRDRLLVRGGAGVEDVLRRFLAFVLDRIEEKPVQLLHHRQHGFAGHGRPAAEHHVDLGHGQQLTRLFCEKRPVGRRIHDHGLQQLAQKPALGVLRFDQHQHRVFQRGFRNRHRARKRMQHADLDGFGLRERKARHRHGGSSGRTGQKRASGQFHVVIPCHLAASGASVLRKAVHSPRAALVAPVRW